MHNIFVIVLETLAVKKSFKNQKKNWGMISQFEKVLMISVYTNSNL